MGLGGGGIRENDNFESTGGHVQARSLRWCLCEIKELWHLLLSFDGLDVWILRNGSAVKVLSREERELTSPDEGTCPFK